MKSVTQNGRARKRRRTTSEDSPRAGSPAQTTYAEWAAVTDLSRWKVGESPVDYELERLLEDHTLSPEQRAEFTAEAERRSQAGVLNGLRLDDAGHADAVLSLYPDRFVFVHEWGWLAWTGTHWSRERGLYLLRSATEDTLIRRMQAAEELYRGSSKAARGKADEIRKGSKPTAGRIQAVLFILEHRLLRQAAEFDADPWLFNVQNGTLDLRTGALRRHDPNDLITLLAPVKFDAAAAAPLWAVFLEQMIPDPTVREFLQRALGYCLTGSTREQAMFYWWGSGNNGKSTILDVVRRVMGPYAMQASHDLLIQQRGEKHASELADLKGRRLVTVQEVPEGRSMAVSIMKAVTGETVMRARRLYHEPFEFQQTGKIILSANNKLEIREDDDGTWRRIRLTPFTVSIPREQVDKTLPDRLADELPGILNWLLAGSIAWHMEGLAEPAAILDASQEYRNESDTVGSWLAERCVLTPQAQYRSQKLYDDYAAWCAANKQDAKALNAWAARLEKRGLTKAKTRTGVIWSGIGLEEVEAEGR